MPLRFRFVAGDPIKTKADALICAEDTMQIMSPRRTIADIAPPETRFEDLIRKAELAKPLPVGTFVVDDHPEEKTAVLIRAVVYDFSRSPTAEPDTVLQTLQTVIEWLATKGIKTIALTAIGAGHGGLAFGQWGKLLGELASHLANNLTVSDALEEILVVEEEPARLTQIRLGFASVPGTNHLRAEAENE